MAPGAASIVITLVLTVLLFVGIPIAIALGLAGLVSIMAGIGGTAWITLTGGAALHNLTNLGFLAIPLFILMGYFVSESGMGEKLVHFASLWFRRFPGYLNIAGIVACGLFSAICGSSVATAAAIGNIILPEMKRRGHSMRWGMGAIAAGGTLGIVIPPSNSFILYGILTETSISKLFAAGILPGLILITLFIIFNIILFSMKPSLNPVEEREEVSWTARWISLRQIWTVMVLIFAVMGGIFFGVVTPTEAAALGALIAPLLGLFVLRSLNMASIHTALLKTVQLSTMLGFIIFSGLILGRGMSALGISNLLVDYISDQGFSPWTVMIIINIFLLILGMFLEGSAIMLVTLPLLFPIVIALGFDPIWFGVIFTINMELGLIVPPVGINVIVIKGIAGESMKEAIIGVLPYIAIMTAVLILIMFIPGIATWLPALMFD